MAITITAFPAYIGFGASLSTVVDTGGKYVVGLIMPEAWTPAPITVQASPDGATYYDLFVRAPDRTSSMEFVFGYTANAVVAVNPNRMLMARYIKLRSGTRSEPIDQEATRMFTVVTVDAAGGAQPFEDVTK